MQLFEKLFSLVLFSLSFNFINCDYFSSIAGLKYLLSLESHYMQSLDNHIQEVEIFNKEIKRFLEKIEVEQIKIQNDASAYFEDPINALKAIKRFAIDWRQMEEFTHQIQASNVYTESSSRLPEHFTLPTEDDLGEAASGLMRLQRIHKLKSEDIANGQLGSYRSNATLTFSDCFVLGQQLYDLNEHFLASEWLIKAMQRLDDAQTEKKQDENNTDNERNDIHSHTDDIERYPDVTHIKILEFLGSALYNAGNPKLALFLNDKLLALDPENEFGVDNEPLFEQGAKEERRLRLLKKS